MKTILVPTDFSLNATKALNFAVEIAAQAHASVILLNIDTLIENPFRAKTELEKKHGLPQNEAIQKELSEITKEIKDGMHINIRSERYGGAVVNAITQAADYHHADMIVMGTLGNAGAKEKLMGSVTAAVIGKVNIPVLAVPLLSEWAIPKNILLAVNHFDEKPAHAKPIIDIARLFYAKITVAVFTDENKAVAANYIENNRGVGSYGEQLQSLYKDTNIETGKLYGKKFEETITDYIKAEEVDLIAMFTHKRGLVGSIFNRSMTKSMSYHTNIPLLAIPV